MKHIRPLLIWTEKEYSGQNEKKIRKTLVLDFGI
jgi:hypothetical protein